MISGAASRRLLALVTGVAVVSAFTLVTGAPAAAVETLTVRSATPAAPGLTTQIDVSATSSSDITQITATLRLVGSAEVFATVDDFARLSGTARDGVWRSATAVTVEDHKRYAIDIDATNAAGYHRHLADVGVIDNGLDAAFSEFQVAPAVFDIEHREVTYRGRLADGAGSGIPNVRITLVAKDPHDGSPHRLGEVMTGSGGSFSATFELTTTRSVFAVSTADATYRSARSEPVTATFTSLPTRVSISVRTNPGVIGQKITLTGRLERQSRDGTWAGLAGQGVRIWLTSQPSTDDFTDVMTGSDGTYTANIVIPSRGQWNVRFPSDVLDFGAGYRSSADGTDLVQAQYRTAVTGFNAGPEPVGKGASVQATGRVVRTLKDGTTAGLAKAYVDLEFSTDGKTWTQLAPAYADAGGYFTVSVTAVKDGYWRAHFDETYDDKGSISGSDHVDVRYRTSISSFNASPEPVAKGKTITVSGKLNRYVSAWGPLGGKTVYIYFRPYGATAWSYMGVATSDKYGKWHKGFTAGRDGTWYAKYKGSDTYLPVTSGGDYVDVR